jgi:hypothetical protein
MTPHNLDPVTQFCLKCGAAMQDVANGERRECADANVIAISHILSHRRFAALGFDWPLTNPTA